MEMEMVGSMNGLVNDIKENWFSKSTDIYSFVLVSAYDTAWVAMIPHPDNPDFPMFPNCLEWILHNQNELGFWGEATHSSQPNIECLSATIACMVALKTWDVGSDNIDKGLLFVYASTEGLLSETNGEIPRWFAIDFPVMVELAQRKGLKLFSKGSTTLMEPIIKERQRIFQMEEPFVNGVNKEQPSHQACHPPLMYILEALPAKYGADWEEILQHQQEKESLFRSPSATAQAFMATKNKKCQDYLESMVERCGFGVPPMYPVDEELIKLSMVDRLQRLGLAEYFVAEIDDVLVNVYRNWIDQDQKVERKCMSTSKMYKDALAFRLLRTHGYRVSPSKFCWFLDREDVVSHMEDNYEYFLSTMLNVYQASNLMFLGEIELEKARSFSRKILEKEMSKRNQNYNVVPITNLQRQIGHELSLPWLARLDHLEHRKYIVEYEANEIQVGRAYNYRLCCLFNKKLLQLAEENFTSRQLIFKRELEELKRWAKDSGICDMGFGREKTTYCYFSIASAEFHHHLSDVRMETSKSAILLTLIDDFFDENGTMEELNSITTAIERWDGEALHGHSKVLFRAVVDLIEDIVRKVFNLHGHDVTKNFQEIWHQTLVSWLKEAEWSRRGHAPSIDEYLEVGKTSTSIEAIILPALYFTAPDLSNDMVHHFHYKMISNLVRVLCRFLNDMQSYKKEEKDGKSNLVHLYLKKFADANIKDAISYITKMADITKLEFLEHVLMDDMNCIWKSWKQMHLLSLKVFQMFYNSSNAYDSPTEMLESINKAIYEPIMMQDLCFHQLQDVKSRKRIEGGKSRFIVRSGGNGVGGNLSNHIQETFLPNPMYLGAPQGFRSYVSSIQWGSYWFKTRNWHGGLNQIGSLIVKSKKVNVTHSMSLLKLNAPAII